MFTQHETEAERGARAVNKAERHLTSDAIAVDKAFVMQALYGLVVFGVSQKRLGSKKVTAGLICDK